MTRKASSPRTGGFTLVEVMMAAVIMVLAIVGMIQVIVSGSEMLDISRKQTIAMQVIHGQMDNIRRSDWTQVTALATSVTVDVDGGDQSGFVFGTALPTITKGFRCTRTISDVRTDLKQVTFTVTWTGNTGRSHTRSGSTYVGKNGLYVSYQRS
jgi:Tfp pilus assembly protein PilV